MLCLLTVMLAACGGAANVGSDPGGANGAPNIASAAATVNIPATGGKVSLPVPTTSPAQPNGDSISADFPALPSQIPVAVTDFDGGVVAAPATNNIWGTTCPAPLEQIALVFPTALQLPATPSITISSSRISGNPTFYYNELFDADTTPGTIIAREKVLTSSSWAPETAVLPSMDATWNIIAGHQYVFEVVASTDPNLSCTNTYNN